MNQNLKLAAVLAFAAVAGTAVAETFIVEDGKPNAEIVISGRAANATKAAANFLSDSLEKISGAKLAVVTTPTGTVPVKIYVGPSEFTEKLGIKTDDLDHDACRMKSGDDYLALVGRDVPFFNQRGEKAEQLFRLAALKFNDPKKAELWTKWYKEAGGNWGLPYGQLWKDHSRDLDVWAQDEHGSFTAVADFLRALGMRWYMPGEIGKVIPKKKSIPLPKVDKTDKPDFPVRFANRRRFNDADEVLWEFWVGFNRGQDVIDPCFPQHGINAVTDFRTKKSLFAHPRADEPKPDEFYAQYDGKRSSRGRMLKGQEKPGKQCLGSPKLIAENARYARARFDVFESPMVGVMPGDGYTRICECEFCKGKDTPELGPLGCMSNYAWEYVDKVARETYKTHPDKMILGTSYGTYRMAPPGIDTFSPNVVVCICQHRCRFGQRPEEKKMYVGFRKGFLEKLPKGRKNLLMYEYYRGARHTPHYNPHAIAEDLKSLKGVGLGDMIDVDSDSLKEAKRDGYTRQTKMSVFHLDQYVTGRFLWDADQDVDAMLEDYYEKFYGPAAKEMKALVEFGEANWMDITGDKERIDKTLELLKAVQDKVDPESVYGQRVALIADYLAPLKKLRDLKSIERVGVPTLYVSDRTGNDIVIDGKLDDPFWGRIHMTSKGRLKESRTGRAPSFETRYMFGFTNGNIYLAVRCQDVEGDPVNVTTKKNDDPALLDGDYVEIDIETPGHSYYRIAVNPAGAVYDLDKALDEKSRLEWNSEVEVATQVGDDYWSLEMRIPVPGAVRAELLPFQGVSGNMPSYAFPWYVNVFRHRERGDDVLILALNPSGVDDGKLDHPEKFAKIIAGRQKRRKGMRKEKKAKE